MACFRFTGIAGEPQNPGMYTLSPTKRAKWLGGRQSPSRTVRSSTRSSSTFLNVLLIFSLKIGKVCRLLSLPLQQVALAPPARYCDRFSETLCSSTLQYPHFHCSRE